MPKTLENTHDLVQADFREIQNLLTERYEKEFTVEYIRKVCKGKRTNSEILSMALKYVELLNEQKSKMKKLAS